MYVCTYTDSIWADICLEVRGDAQILKTTELLFSSEIVDYSELNPLLLSASVVGY